MQRCTHAITHKDLADLSSFAPEARAPGAIDDRLLAGDRQLIEALRLAGAIGDTLNRAVAGDGAERLPVLVGQAVFEEHRIVEPGLCLERQMKGAGHDGRRHRHRRRSGHEHVKVGVEA